MVGLNKLKAKERKKERNTHTQTEKTPMYKLVHYYEPIIKMSRLAAFVRSQHSITCVNPCEL